VSVAAAVLPGRAGPLLSCCGCTDCSHGVPRQLAVPEFLESEQRRPLALAARRRSLRPGSLRSASRLFEPPRRDPGPPRRADRWRAVSKPGIRISANPVHHPFAVTIKVVKAKSRNLSS